MTFKIVTVMGFLLVLGMFQSHWRTWGEIASGFIKFGNVPVRSIEDRITMASSTPARTGRETASST